MTAAYVVALLIALGIVALGVSQAMHVPRVWSVLAIGAAALVAVLVGWPIAASISSRGGDEVTKALAPLSERLQEFSVMLTLISEQQMLSDRAKSVAFRDKDREAVRRAIQEEIA